jgi:hypothetical protein
MLTAILMLDWIFFLRGLFFDFGSPRRKTASGIKLLLFINLSTAKFLPDALSTQLIRFGFLCIHYVSFVLEQQFV